MNAGVLFGLGLSMVLLAAVIWLPASVALGVGLAIIVGDTALANVELPDGWFGTVLALATRSQDFEPVSGYHFFVSYPPIPWFGAMAFGYGIADLVYARSEANVRVLLGFGAAFIAGFVVVRGLQLGDPSPWTSRLGGIWTVLSFVDVSKYPPSTAFLLLTLGGALLFVAAFERWPARGRLLETYGRVPLFFYLVHIPLVHLIAVIYAYVKFGTASWLTSGPVIFWDTSLPGAPASYGFDLPGVWAIWLAFVAALYPVCRWLAARRSRYSVYTRT